VQVSHEIVDLAEERLLLWTQLRQMAGLSVPPDVRDVIEAEFEGDFARKLAALREEYEGKLAELRGSYPKVIARRLAGGLVRAGAENGTVGELLARAVGTPGLAPLRIDASASVAVAPAPAAGAAAAARPAAAASSAEAPVVAADEDAEDEDFGLDPYIESARCTACNECTNINSKLFAYDDKKLAYIKDPKAGTFKQLVTAAERCPVRIIHPGTPLNPNEKDLEKWVKRAEPFN
jgi:pyruvate-ferredoxin/flavodoxin oxidoreductase